jgi:hypothetical protein
MQLNTETLSGRVPCAKRLHDSVRRKPEMKNSFPIGGDVPGKYFGTTATNVVTSEDHKNFKRANSSYTIED